MRALKATYNRSTKTYDVQMVDAESFNTSPEGWVSPLPDQAITQLAYEGWFVFDDTLRAIGGIVAGVFMGNVKPEVRTAILDWLLNFVKENRANGGKKK